MILTQEIKQFLEELEIPVATQEELESKIISQTKAAQILAKRFDYPKLSRQRVSQYISHPEHSKYLRLVGEKRQLYLIDVLNFQLRKEFSGKRGKKKRNGRKHN